eukprot:s1424_g10.t1
MDLMDRGSFGPLLMAPTVLVIAVAAAVQLEIGVVTSSFCADVDSNSLAFIGKLTGYDSEEYQLSKYYITGEGDNPLLMDLSNASEQLSSANASITAYGREVEALCSWRGLEELEKGAATAQTSLDFGDSVSTSKKANGSTVYQRLLRQDLCQTTMIGLGWLVLFQVIVGLLLLPLLVCVATRYLQARRGWYQGQQEAVELRGARAMHGGPPPQVIEAEQKSLKWYTMADFVELVGLEAKVTRQIIGTLMARCADYIREDLGMNLMVEARGDKGALCLPCYSIKHAQGWFFSDLAVSALKDYQEKFPGVFEALRARQDEKKDLEQRNIFPTSPNKDYASRQLLKYCNGCEWKKLRLAPAEYMAMTVESVTKVAEMVQKISSPQQTITVTGSSSFFQVEDPSMKPPSDPSRKDLAIGQRGFYIIMMRPQGVSALDFGVLASDLS